MRPDNAEAEEKGVGLQIADLKQTEERTGSPGRAAGTTHSAGIDDPAIDKMPRERESIPWVAFDQPRIEFIEVETAPQNRDVDRIGFARSR